MHDGLKLGRQLKKARQDKKWTQALLGQECGVQKAQISKLEKDATSASMALFLRACEALRLRLDLHGPDVWDDAPPRPLDPEAILEQLPPDVQAQLEAEARAEVLRQVRLPALVIGPAVKAKMLELWAAQAESDERMD